MPKRYYWLKLKKDFFKRHDIRIIEGMKDGHEIVLVYIKLLCESLDHDGDLRFSDKIPYTVEMLSRVLDSSVDVVAPALEMFKQLGLVDEKKDGTFHMNHLADMLGSETEWAEKKRTYRGQSEDKPRTLSSDDEDKPRTDGGQKKTLSDKSIENRVKSIENRVKSLDIIEEREEKEEREVVGEDKTSPITTKTKSRFIPPSVEEVVGYCKERKNDVDAERFVAYYDSVGWKIGGKAPMKDWRAAVRTWEKRAKSPPGARADKSEVPYMEKEYTREYDRKKEDDDLAEILGLEDE